MNNRSPIFIGGAGRSGTTLLVDMLGLHPRISPIYETDFVVQLIELIFQVNRPAREPLAELVTQCMDDWTRPLPHRPHNKREHERYHHGPHHILFDRKFALDRTAEFVIAVKNGRIAFGFRNLLIALFREHCRLDQKARWANKTPAYVQHLPALHRLFPKMRFIHCIRDGRDVVCSVMTRTWRMPSVGDAASWWANKVRLGVEFREKHPEQCLDVRYEDLVRQPEPTLNRICAWLDEESCPDEILRCYRAGGVRLDAARIGEWQRTLSAADQRAVEQHAGEWLTHFDYPRTNA